MRIQATRECVQCRSADVSVERDGQGWPQPACARDVPPLFTTYVSTTAAGAEGATAVVIPGRCPFKKGMGLDFTIFQILRFFVIFRKTVFFHKPLRDERYGDGSTTVETGRSGRFFSVLLI